MKLRQAHKILHQLWLGRDYRNTSFNRACDRLDVERRAMIKAASRGQEWSFKRGAKKTVAEMRGSSRRVGMDPALTKHPRMGSSKILKGKKDHERS